MRKFFCKKIVIAKSDILPFISNSSAKDWPRMDWFSKEKNSDKNPQTLRLKFARKVCHKRAMCNYEILNDQKDCGTRDQVEVNLLKSALHINTSGRIFRWSFTYIFNKFQRSKWEGLWNLAEIDITKEYNHFSNSENMDRLSCNALP